MLCLSRKKDEEITIGPDVTIRVLSIQGQKVKLGLTAPASVRIMRKEVESRIPADQIIHSTEPQPMRGTRKLAVA